MSRLLEAGSCVVILVALLTLAVWCWGFSIRAWRVARALSIFAGMSLCIFLYWERFSLHFVYRLVHVSNGVSPVVPTVLLSLGLLWYAYSHLNRIPCAGRAQPDCPLSKATSISEAWMD